MTDIADSAKPQLGVGAAALNPADVGAWQVLSSHSEVLAVHAALLPSGDVLFAAGSGNSLPRFQSPDFGNVAKKVWVSVVWDPTISPPPGGDTNFFHPATPHDGARTAAAVRIGSALADSVSAWPGGEVGIRVVLVRHRPLCTSVGSAILRR